MQTLENERLLLRELKESDWFDVHRYASQEKVCQYQPWGPNTTEESKGFVKQVLEDAGNTPRTRYVFAITNRTDEMIGAAELNARDTNNLIGEISYIVNPDYWGQGIATDAARLLIKFGFDQFKLHRIYATCDPRKAASSKVLERSGLSLEGKIREDLWIKDGWRDSLLYSILDYEWK